MKKANAKVKSNYGNGGALAMDLMVHGQLWKWRSTRDGSYGAWADKNTTLNNINHGITWGIVETVPDFCLYKYTFVIGENGHYFCQYKFICLMPSFYFFV